MTRQVPTFTLYGEQHDWPTPDLIHWESVAQRSRLHNWRIHPHRHSKLLQFIYLQQGRATVHLDEENFAPPTPCLLVIPPLCVHGFDFSPDMDGHVLTVAAPVIEQLRKQLGAKDWLTSRGRLFPNAGKALADIFEVIAEEYRDHRPLRDWALQTAVNRLVIWVLRSDADASTQQEQQPNKNNRHLARFTRLIEAHYSEHQPLSFYADKLGVSQPHLNSICRQLADRSALQLIHERLLLEAKRNLVYTAMNVGEIAISLGFSEPAYFTRFFKKQTGLSPLDFRQQNR